MQTAAGGFLLPVESAKMAHHTVSFRSAVAKHTPAAPQLPDRVQIECVCQNFFGIAVSLFDQPAGLVGNKGRTIEGQAGRLMLVVRRRRNRLGTDTVRFSTGT